VIYIKRTMVWYKFAWLILLVVISNVVGQWSQVDILAPPELLDNDEFGSTTAMSGDKLAVGAPNDAGAGTFRGVVYTFQWSGSMWVQDSTVLAPTELSDSDRFGSAIAMSGDKLAVGSYYYDGVGFNRGGVFTYQWSGSVWVQDSTILSPTELLDSDSFGYSIDMDGDKMIVSAPYEDGAGSAAGAVYTFQWSGSAWVQDSTVLIPAELLAGDNFGISLTLSGDKMAVGASGDDGAGSNRGVVYTYQWSGSAWVQDSSILSPTELLDNYYFGHALVMVDDKLAVGAYRDSGVGPNRGAVYTFQWSGSAWVQDSTMLAPTELLDSDNFGRYIDMNNNTIVVGTPNDDDVSPNAGAVYTFQWSGSAWVQDSTVLAPSELLSGDQFGRSIVLDGDKLAVGAPRDAGAGTFRGIVYAFSAISSTNSPTMSPTNNPTTAPSNSPTSSPTKNPTSSPTSSPTKNPTSSPTSSPTKNPTSSPTTKTPTSSPTSSPTNSPTSPVSSTLAPTPNPTICSCENGGTCLNDVCHCLYPYYGLNCELIVSCACQEAPTGSPTIAPTIAPTFCCDRKPAPTQECNELHLCDLID
jgi:hypothetical protein